MAYYYIAETNIAYLNRDKDKPLDVYGTKVCIFRSCILRLYKNSSNGLGFRRHWGRNYGMGKYHCDFTITKPALVALKDYEKQKKKEKIQYSSRAIRN